MTVKSHGIIIHNLHKNGLYSLVTLSVFLEIHHISSSIKKN